MIREREDEFRGLDSAGAFGDKLAFLYGRLRHRYAFIERVAVAVYDAKTDLLKTYASSGDTPSPLTFYQSPLSNSPTLQEIADSGLTRVVNDMDVFAASGSRHAQALRDAGFQASYTAPLFADSKFIGFVFFNSRMKRVFTPAVLSDCDMVAHLVGLLLAREVSVSELLQATVKSALSFTRHRDPETAGHLDRMSRYARMVAREVAPAFGLNDVFVESVFLFSPVHDIGKISVPDHILLKQGPLTADEFEEMKRHTLQGAEIVDKVVENYNLGKVQDIRLLRNIVLYHHENYDGSGYPKGLSGEAIPLEARIVAISDVFDALTSKRVYKEAWDNERAFDYLQSQAGTKFDPVCVAAMLDNQAELEVIQQQFKESIWF